jgi:FMN phosphatase YigB (HAD superfamily)
MVKMAKGFRMDEDKKILKIAFDCDGTLIHNGDPDFLDSKGEPLDSKPRYSVVNLYKAFELLGMDLYIWSSEGKAHAKLWKKRLGLEGKVIKKDKEAGMDIAVDNADDGYAKVTIKV